MSGKRKKPPIEKASVWARLEYARQHQLLAHLRRWIPRADRIEGFVVAIGKRWVVLQRLSDRVAFDGWVLVRLKDIQSVSVNPDADCFGVAVLQARGLWPPVAPDLNLDNAVGVLSTAAAAAPVMISVFDEFDNPEACRIGNVLTVTESRLKLLEVDTEGRWKPGFRGFDPRDLTRVDFGGGYEEALSLVSGPPPIPWHPEPSAGR